MKDEILGLLSNDPNAQTQALVAVLRRQQMEQQGLQRGAGLGAMLQAGGGKLTAPFGQQMARQAAQRGQDIGNERQSLLKLTMEQRKAAAQEAATDRRLAQQEALTDKRLGAQAAAQQRQFAQQQALQERAIAAAEAKRGVATGAAEAEGHEMPPGYTGPRFERDVQALGKDMETLSTMTADLDSLRKATAGDDVAGFGPVAGLLPGMVMSDEGNANRQAAGRLMAAIIKETSGAAASEAEVERLLEANGLGKRATVDQMRAGVKALEGKYQGLIKQREAKYHPSVRGEYAGRGGLSSSATTAAAPSGMVTVRFRGKTLSIPRGRLEEAKRDGAEEVQ